MPGRIAATAWFTIWCLLGAADLFIFLIGFFVFLPALLVPFAITIPVACGRAARIGWPGLASGLGAALVLIGSLGRPALDVESVFGAVLVPAGIAIFVLRLRSAGADSAA